MIEGYKQIGKLLIIGGASLMLIGVVVYFGGKYLPFGKLPGDISIKKENAEFHFPIMSSIVISIVLSVIMFLVQQFRK